MGHALLSEASQKQLFLCYSNNIVLKESFEKIILNNPLVWMLPVFQTAR